MNRKQQLYREQVVPALMKKYAKDNILAVAKLAKITLNVGMGHEAVNRDKVVQAISEQLAAITGQKPRLNPARISIANFKLREGEIVGLTVTLRGERMWIFLDKLVSIVLPQVKDFSGVSRDSFDQNGNYSLGLREQIIFPEIKYDEIDRVRGLQIVFTINNTSGREESMELFTGLGMPFTKTE